MLLDGDANHVSWAIHFSTPRVFAEESWYRKIDFLGQRPIQIQAYGIKSGFQGFEIQFE